MVKSHNFDILFSYIKMQIGLSVINQAETTEGFDE